MALLRIQGRSCNLELQNISFDDMWTTRLLKQSNVKPNLIMTRSVGVYISLTQDSSFCWFITSPAFILTDHCNCFAFSTATLNWLYLYVGSWQNAWVLASYFCSDLWRIFSVLSNGPNYLSFITHLSYLDIRQTWVD